jgi:predicted permease
MALPGVVSASYASDALLDGGLWTSGIKLKGHSDKEDLETQMLATGPDFFETMRIPLVKGRTFRPPDLRSTQAVAVVNEAFVRKYLESNEPIGFRLGLNDKDSEIIGVVADTKYDDMRKADEPTAYVPLKTGEVTFALRTATVPNSLIPAVRRIVNDVDENLPVFGVRTQSQTIDRFLFTQRLVARLSSLFGLLGLLLASIGLYGLLSYEVARRTREIGIRSALGAQRRDVLRLVIRQGLVLIICGLVAGVTASMIATRFLQSLLFGVRTTDPWTFAAVSVLLVFVGVLACYIPARRATRVDPIVALRYE